MADKQKTSIKYLSIQSVLPMQIVGANGEIESEIICASISGGNDATSEGLPRRLSLMIVKEGRTIQWGEYKFAHLIPIPEQGSDCLGASSESNDWQCRKCHDVGCYPVSSDPHDTRVKYCDCSLGRRFAEQANKQLYRFDD